MKFCPRYSMIIHGIQDNKRVIFRTKCKQWDCPYCGEILQKMWFAHTLDNINKLTKTGYDWYFVTMTAKGGYRTAENTLQSIQDSWRGVTMFWRKLHERIGLDIPDYMRVYEQHKDGNFHLHAIINSALPIGTIYNGISKRNPSHKGFTSTKLGKRGRTYRLKDVCVKYGGGHQVDYGKMDVQNAGYVGAYVTKYLTKDLQGSFNVDKRVRRIQTSESFYAFGQYEKASATDWTIARYLDYDDYRKDFSAGISWYDNDKRVGLGMDDLDNTGYPHIDEGKKMDTSD